ncbi:hypothetical protein IQ231_06120 [Cuspidothrix issatschenkoi LEGE 03284]|nr:hypothetical protein [Cuspidothrix issatschenkoi]MBE9231273.1 hypothetical protein [Cuspidothrix issatschenkoi LEGE 03284]
MLISEEEIENTLDELADNFAAYVDSTVPILSDYAVSRDSIYEAYL